MQTRPASPENSVPTSQAVPSVDNASASESTEQTGLFSVLLRLLGKNPEKLMSGLISNPENDLVSCSCLFSELYELLQNSPNKDYVNDEDCNLLRKTFFKKVKEWTASSTDKNTTDSILQAMRVWPTGATWFDVLMRLNFSGHSVIEYSHDFLGLHDVNKKDPLLLSAVYSYVLDQLKECNGAGTLEDFQKWVDCIVQLDIDNVCPDQEFLDSLSLLDKRMRAKLVAQAPCAQDDNQRRTYNPRFKDDPCSEALRLYDARHNRTKFQLLESILEHAPREWSCQVIADWMNKPDYAPARKILFEQDIYPLNMGFHYAPLWMLPLGIMSRILPDIESPLVKHLQYSSREESLSPERVEDIRAADTVSANGGAKQQPGQSSVSSGSWEVSTGVVGRTIILPPTETNNYLKIQSSKETREAFLQGTKRLKCYNPEVQFTEAAVGTGHNQSPSLPLPQGKDRHLLSDMVRLRRVYEISDIENQLTRLEVSLESIKTVLKLTGSGSRLAAEFSTPLGKRYDNYVYDLPTDDAKKEAIHRYLHDYGHLWSQGVNGPPCINAFHSVREDRHHVTFPYLREYSGTSEGALESWNGSATDFPNIGEVGMRDLWDAHPAGEHDLWCCNKDFVADTDEVATRRNRILELAHACEGAVLIYARCFNQNFLVSDQECVGRVKEDLRTMMMKLFSNAFSLPEDKCCALMEEEGLLDQCTREVCYWLAHYQTPEFYVRDLRNSEINPNAYPHLPKGMKGPVLSDSDAKFLTDYGFHKEGRDKPGECQLGAGSGRTFLTALNAIQAKLITAGISHSAGVKVT